MVNNLLLLVLQLEGWNDMRKSCMVNVLIPSIAQNRACYANGPALCIGAELAEIYTTRVIERIQGGC